MGASYRHIASFISSGKSIRNTSSVRTTTFRYNSLNRQKVRNKARREVVANNIIDRYALRNYWELFEIQVQFADAPWDSYAEVESELIQLENIVSCEYDSEGTFYVGIKDSTFSTVQKNIQDYYNGLNPTPVDKCSLVFDASAKYL